MQLLLGSVSMDLHDLLMNILTQQWSHALSNTEDDKCTLSFNDVIVRNILIEHESFRSDICILIICHIYIFQTPALNVLSEFKQVHNIMYF